MARHFGLNPYRGDGTRIMWEFGWRDARVAARKPTPRATPEHNFMPTTTTTRAEHLAWCKKRALEYVDAGDCNQAFASMASDLSKHPETEKHGAIQLGMMMLMGGHLNRPDQMRKFIEGFN